MTRKSKFVASAAALLLLGAAVFWFQPWRLLTNVEVQEALPDQSITQSPNPDQVTASNDATTGAEPEKEEPTAAFEHEVLLSGKLISHEYKTEGTVSVLKLEDGSRILRIENLDTSDGPQLEVWLSDADVIEGVEGWYLFDDGKFASLGPLKGNLGNQNYQIPDDLVLEDFSSVSIWCVRFAVSFGAAELG